MIRPKFSLPSPLAIAFLLFLTVFVAVLFNYGDRDSSLITDFFATWDMAYSGMWGSGGLSFLVQMGLMLLLGHILALANPSKRLIQRIVHLADTQSAAVLLTAATSMVAGFINWGFGLILGAVLAKSITDEFQRKGKNINAALLAAAAYAGMMIWHGGLSGSAPLKVAETGHLNSLNSELFSTNDSIPLAHSVFSTSNLIVFFIAFTGILLLCRFLAKKPNKAEAPANLEQQASHIAEDDGIDGSRIFALGLGTLMLIYTFYLGWKDSEALRFINPNFINLTLLAAALILHGSLSSFSRALDQAIQGTSGILMQFPIYFAIMGMMSSSGMANDIAEFFVSISNEHTLAFNTFLSAGIINLVVPSGGGQWMIQGPIIIESFSSLGIPLEKGLMALSYGDQLTNMLQPFWALPLLGITKVKAKDLLPYTALFFALGFLVFGIAVFVI